MGPIDRIIWQLADPTPRLHDALTAAAFILEKAAAARATNGRAAVSDQSIQRLADALRHFIRRRPQHPEMSTAVMALGQLRNADDEPVFARTLEQHLNGDGDVVQEALIALEKLGRVQGAPPGVAGAEQDMCRACARWYLAVRKSHEANCLSRA